MTVYDLQQVLEGLDPELEIFLATDAEGNNFRAVAEVETAVFNYRHNEFDFDNEGEPNSVLIWPN